MAAILIVAFHADALVPHGFIAVDMFFVVSGFVITAMLLRERTATGTIRLRTFYRRRFLRLFPTLALMVSVVSVAGVVLLSPFAWNQVGPAGLSSLLAVSNVYFAVATDGYFDPAADSIPFLHTWSLSVEEQFYLVYPALVIVALARGRRLGVLRTTLVAVVGVSFALCVVLTLVTFPGPLSFQLPRLAFYAPFTRAWEFAVGGLVALSVGRLARRSSHRSATVISWVGVGMLGASLAVVDESSFPGWSAALPVAATSLLLVSGVMSPSPTLVGRLLSTPVMTWLGDRSYTWYVWHWPLIVMTRQWWPDSRLAVSLAAVGSLGVAALAYRYVERPIHRGHLGRTARVRLVSTTAVGGSLIACGVMIVASATSLGNDTVREERAIVAAEHLDHLAGCDHGGVVTALPDACHVERPGDHGRALLIGDSHAGHYSEAFLDATRGLGLSADIISFPSCPFARGVSDDPGCAAFVDDNLDALASGRRPYDLVVVSTAALNAVRSPSMDVGTRGSAGWWGAAVERTWAPIAAQTTVVSVVDNVQFPGMPTCVRRSVVRTAVSPSCLVPGPTYQARHDAVATAESAAMQAVGGAELDSTAALCDQTCRPIDARGMPTYRDVSHLTVRESTALAPVWQERLAQVLTAPRS